MIPALDDNVAKIMKELCTKNNGNIKEIMWILKELSRNSWYRSKNKKQKTSERYLGIHQTDYGQSWSKVVELRPLLPGVKWKSMEVWNKISYSKNDK